MVLIWLPVVVFLMDRLTKYIVVTTMVEEESIPILQNVFHLTYILNPGAAFGLFAHNRSFFLLIAAVALGAIWYMRQDILAEEPLVKYGVGLFVGGTLGNVWDRAANGLVVDFFDFRVWPIFNVADIAICLGVGCIIWSLIRTEFLKPKE